MLPFAFLLTCLVVFGWELSFVLVQRLERGLPSGRTLRGLCRVATMAAGCLVAIGFVLYHLSGVLGRDVRLGLLLGRLLGDIVRGQVACFSGRVTVNRSGDIDPALFGSPVRHYFCLADQKFEVPPEAYDELQLQGGTALLILYFTPRSGLLVAAEPVLSMQAE